MRLELDNVIPAPLREHARLDSEIWGRQASFDRPGFYQILAPSGRGKTTFTHIIYGLRRDYSGEFRIDGNRAQEIDTNEWAKLRQRRLSIVFQDLRLFPHLTAWENIRVNAVLQPYLSQDELRKLCQELSIDGLLHKHCDRISFGERQRVAIIRAIAQPFEWLLLDEPFSHLDSDNAQRVSRLLARQCHMRGAGCMLMSLDQSQRFDFHQTYRL